MKNDIEKQEKKDFVNRYLSPMLRKADSRIYGVSEQEASDIAYLYAQALAFDEIAEILVANEIKPSSESFKKLEKLAQQTAYVSSGCSITVRTGD